MSDKDVWLLLYQAILSDSDISIERASEFADEALAEYKKRWAND